VGKHLAPTPWPLGLGKWSGLHLGTADRNAKKVLAPIMETTAGQPGAMSAIWGTRKRLLIFAANGVLVFCLGVVVQLALIHQLKMGNVSSYLVKTVLSVQLTFLLSRYLTWRDRNLAWLPALGRWNVQQVAISGLSVGLYAGLDHLGLGYIRANLVVAVISTPLSFVVGHVWSMAERRASLSLRTVP
jgi:putative flippase GtrA